MAKGVSVLIFCSSDWQSSFSRFQIAYATHGRVAWSPGRTRGSWIDLMEPIIKRRSLGETVGSGQGPSDHVREIFWPLDLNTVNCHGPEGLKNKRLLSDLKTISAHPLGRSLSFVLLIMVHPVLSWSHPDQAHRRGSDQVSQCKQLRKTITSSYDSFAVASWPIYILCRIKRFCYSFAFLRWSLTFIKVRRPPTQSLKKRLQSSESKLSPHDQ